MPKQRVIHAELGHWKCEKDSTGKVLSYVGRFHQEDQNHAMGTAAFFAHSKITRRYVSPFKDSDNYWCVRITYHQDNLHKFEHWLMDHPDLMPKRAKEVAESEMLAEVSRWQDEEAKKNTPIFRPLAKRHAEDMIRRMKKELVEIGYQNAWVLVSDVPEVALQAATYLEREGYISKKTYDSVCADVNYAVKNGQVAEFRMCIAADKTKQFSNEFVLDAPSSPLSYAEADAIIRRSYFIGGHRKIAG